MRKIRTLAAIGLVFSMILLAAANGFAALTGDVDGSDTVDLKDTMMSFQISTGVTPFLTVNRQADVDGDGVIGLKEAIYSLQLVGKLRIPTLFTAEGSEAVDIGISLLEPSADNTVHHSIKVKNFLKRNPLIILKYLSPYSPEYNPIERYWLWLKKKVYGSKLISVYQRSYCKDQKNGLVLQ